MLWGVFSKTGLFFSKILFFQNFNWSKLFFNQSKLWSKVMMSLCLFRSIETNFRSIENRESGFQKIRFDLLKSLFQNFFKLLFLSPIRTSTILYFFSFLTKFFARFSSLKASMSIIPFLFHLFSIFHALKGYFWT